MSICEKCNHRGYVADLTRNSLGHVRRRFFCKKCGHRWTEWNGDKPKSAAPDKRLSDHAIFDILTDKSSRSVLAIRHGCSVSTVGQVRRGEMHASVHPEIPRSKTRENVNRKSCKRCLHYTNQAGSPCDLGHIDPVQEGLTFAAYCSNFLPVERQP